MIFEAIEPIAKACVMEILLKEFPLMSPDKLNVSVDFLNPLDKCETDISNALSPLEIFCKSFNNESKIGFDRSVDFVKTTHQIN